jgi:hypothetical protein
MFRKTVPTIEGPRLSVWLATRVLRVRAGRGLVEMSAEEARDAYDHLERSNRRRSLPAGFYRE